jgi:hypothetical protein
MQDLKAQGFKEAKRVKVRYGPYRVPGMMDGDLGKQMEKSGGMVWNLPDLDVQKPCTECLLTFMQAGLEDGKGNDMNTNNGLWMHHMYVTSYQSCPRIPRS